MKVGENMRIPEPVLNEDFYMVKRIGGDVALPTPRTRFEELLYIYAGGTIERPTPKTVEERFLDYITGGESELPAPKTRLQSYMYNVANPSNKIPVVPPKTRFECYWFVMATANAIISTDNPVEFTSLDGFLLDYTIWGNTEQGVSEIEINNAFVDEHSIDEQTGTVISEQGHTAILNPLTLGAGTYYVDYSVNTEENVTCQYSVFDGGVLVGNVVNETSTPFSITLVDSYLVYFSLYPTNKDAIESFTITTSDGQIFPTPDYQIDVKGVGDYSNNIMPEILVGYRLNYNTGDLISTTASGYSATDYFIGELNENTSLIFSGLPNGYSMAILVYTMDKTFIGRSPTRRVRYNTTLTNNAVLTAGKYYFRIGFTLGSNTPNFDLLLSAKIMLSNDGIIDQTYVPPDKYIIPLSVTRGSQQNESNYIALDEPLQAIDNHLDSVNYLSQKETKKVKKLVVDGIIDPTYAPPDKYIIPLSVTGGSQQNESNYIGLDEPLHAIDNYVDNVNYLSQKETKKVKKLVVDGTNVKFSVTTTGDTRLGVGIAITESEAPTDKVWSNIAIFSTYTGGYVTMRNIFSAKLTNSLRIYLYFPKNYINIESPTSAQILNFFNNKAQELYNNDTPIIFYYVPNATEEVPTEIPKIPTYAPATELTLDTEVQPSKIEIVTRTE